MGGKWQMNRAWLKRDDVESKAGAAKLHGFRTLAVRKKYDKESLGGREVCCYGGERLLARNVDVRATDGRVGSQ